MQPTIIPIVLAVITVILMLLLRSVLAPLILLAVTLLSYLATLGVSALLFNHVLHMPGADPTVPLYGFVFLVALGIDYTILDVRVRAHALGMRSLRDDDEPVLQVPADDDLGGGDSELGGNTHELRIVQDPGPAQR